MDAEPEPEMVVRVPGDVEPFRLVELLRIAVGRGDEQHGEVAGFEVHAAVLAVLGHGPRRQLHGGDVAEHLLDTASSELRIGAEQFALVGMAEKSEGASGDQVDRGLVPGHQQQDAGRQHLGPHSSTVTPSSALTSRLSRSSP